MNGSVSPTRLLDATEYPTVFAAGEAVMTDRSSLVAFVVSTIVLTATVGLGVPLVLRRLRLAGIVSVLGVLAPVLCAAIVLIGAAMMALAGHEVGVMLVIAAAAGAASGWAALRIAGPLSRDMAVVAESIDALATSRPLGADLACTTPDAQALLDEVRRGQILLARSVAARDAAEASRRLVVAGLSHDLRTPLHSLLASVDALEDGVGSVEQNRAELRSAAAAMDQLVTDLFLVARAESGILEVTPEVLDASEIIEDVTDSVAALARARGVALLSKVDRSVLVETDELAIGRILRNLLDNAVRHTRSGGIVSVEARTTPGGWVDIEIRDQGPGLGEDIARRGAAASASTRRSHGGAGLGLRIAATLAQAVGGRVQLTPGPPGLVTVTLRSATGASLAVAGPG